MAGVFYIYLEFAAVVSVERLAAFLASPAFGVASQFLFHESILPKNAIAVLSIQSWICA